MSQQVKIPTVGESITEVTIANWLKNDGDLVKMDEVIAELDSDKATFELTAPQAGFLKILKQKGETVPIGTVICEVADSAQVAAAPASTPTATPAPTPAKPVSNANSQPTKPGGGPVAAGGIKEMKVPAVGESITEVTISTWLKKDGDFVTLDEIIAEVESDKATFELPAEATGILRIVAKEKTTLPIGGLICRIEIAEGGAAPAKTATPAAKTETAGGNVNYAAGLPSPAAAKILDEKGIASNQVQGSGVGGRITKEDAVKAESSSPAKESKPAPTLAPPVITSG